MSWKIEYTAQARKDLRDIYEYIALELLVPENAAGQTRRIMQIESKNTVNIVRIMYGGRDVHRQLGEKDI